MFTLKQIQILRPCLAFGRSILLRVWCFIFSIQSKRLTEILVAIPGSFVFTMLCLPLYAVVAPAIGFSTEYQGIVPRLWTNSVFYFVLLFLPLFCLVRDYAWK